jgi:predicted dehydrogenase
MEAVRMISAAVVGVGWWGKSIITWMKESTVVRIVAGVDPNAGPRSFLAEHGLEYFSDLNDVLSRPDIDLIVLATPHKLHTEQILNCASAGKHVFCEKPLALSRADAQRSIEACSRAGVKLGIGHERRFEPAMEALRALVQSGALGTFLHAEANFSHDKMARVPAQDWRGSRVESAEPGMTGMGVHMTDLMIDLFGPVEEVNARADFFYPGDEMGAVIGAVLGFVNGGMAYLNVTTLTPLYMRLATFGSTGWAEVRNYAHPNSAGNTTLQVSYRDGLSETREFQEVAGASVRANIESLAWSFQNGRSYRFSETQLLENIAVLEGILMSTKLGAAVKLSR